MNTTLEKVSKTAHDGLIVGARNIRKELKNAYPGIKFTVLSERFSMGDAINIRWTDGPCEDSVDDIVRKYKGSSFDGMQDLKESVSTDFNSVYGNADYVTTGRDLSEGIKSKVQAFFESERFAVDRKHEYGFAEQTAWRLLRKTDIPKGASFESIGEREEVKCWGVSSPWKKFYVTFKKPQVIEPVCIDADKIKLAETTHAKKGVPLFVATFEERVSKERYSSALSAAKQFGGYYSNYKRDGAIPGFQFRAREDRDDFLAALRTGKVASKAGQNGDKLRKSAKGLEGLIQAKLNPAIADQNPTPRRARIAASMESEGLKLQQVQRLMLAIADKLDAGECPPELAAVTGRESARKLLATSQYARDLAGRASESQERDRSIKAKERDLIGRKIPGFFETPRNVVAQMLQLADISQGCRILEPNGGAGSILEGLRDSGHKDVDTCEVNPMLRELLTCKGFNVVGRDFLEFEPETPYDRVLMNPPFEKGADAEHIRKAWDLLAPGGILVAICCEGLFFRSGSKEADFRAWLQDKLDSEEKLPQETFRGGRITSTGANARLVVIRKR